MTGTTISNALNLISVRHIEEAADFQIKTNHSRARFPLRKAVALAAAMLLVFAMSVSALAAADIGSAYDLLYAVSPTIAQSLKPVRMACEDQGILFELISADVVGSEAKALVSVRDLEGDRIDATTDLFDSYSINTPFACIGTCKNISYDAEAKTATFLISISQENGRDIAGEKLTFRVREMISRKQTYDAALPELNLNALEAAAGTFTPSDIRGGGGADYAAQREDFQALVSAGTVCAPVDGVAVTAAGYVAGKLHIQVRYDAILETDNHGYVYLKNEAGDVIQCDTSISYFGDGEKKESFSEYIFDLAGKDISDYIPYGHFVTSSVNLKGNWSVTFPLERVSP